MVGRLKMVWRNFIQWCFEHPKLFWAIIIIGGIGDLIFFNWAFS